MPDKVLVIDDDPGVGEMIKDFLEFDKVEVMLSTTPEDGLFSARYKMPSLILLDLFMPNISGFELYKKLKNDDRTKDIPIIIITGHTDSQTLAMMNDLGIKGVFYKPFQFRHLRKKIMSILQGEQDNKSACKRCGAELEDDWDYCPYDGWRRK